jgi:DNA-binding NtrC family response regulator
LIFEFEPRNLLGKLVSGHSLSCLQVLAAQRNGGALMTTKADKRQLLLVEDDELFRQACTQSLELLGFSVVDCESLATLRDFLAQPDRPTLDAVVSDFNLPDGTAADVGEALVVAKAVTAETPWIIISGRKENQEPAEQLDATFLFKQGNVADQINALLDA